MSVFVAGYIFGGALLCADVRDTESILNICMRYRLVYRRLNRSAERVTFECTLYTASFLLDVCAKHDVSVKILRKYGLPVKLYRYRQRVGIAVGLFLAAAIIILSGRYVWDIRISGLESVSEELVLSELREQQFYVGAYLPGSDIDMIENRVLINSEELAWISINVRGSVAYVEVRERVPEPEKKDDSPANLVATWDGQIESIAVTRGLVMVRAGEHVRRGQLLVGGIYDSNALGLRYVRAAGEITAKTVRTLRVEIPYVYEVRQYSGEEIKQTTVFFFSKEIKLYRNTGFLGGTYDTISNVENFSLFDGTRLPASYSTTTYRYYTNVRVRRDENEASRLAYAELDSQIEELTANGALLLRKNVSWSSTEDAFILECTVSLLENIAGIVEIEISD